MTALGRTLGILFLAPLVLALSLLVLVQVQHIAACWQFSWIGNCWAGWEARQERIRTCGATHLPSNEGAFHVCVDGPAR